MKILVYITYNFLKKSLFFSRFDKNNHTYPVSVYRRSPKVLEAMFDISSHQSFGALKCIRTLDSGHSAA